MSKIQKSFWVDPLIWNAFLKSVRHSNLKVGEAIAIALNHFAKNMVVLVKDKKEQSHD